MVCIESEIDKPVYNADIRVEVYEVEIRWI